MRRAAPKSTETSGSASFSASAAAKFSKRGIVKRTSPSLTANTTGTSSREPCDRTKTAFGGFISAARRQATANGPTGASL